MIRFLVENRLVIPLLALLAAIVLFSRFSLGFLKGVRRTRRPEIFDGEPCDPPETDPYLDEPRLANGLSRSDLRFLFTIPKGTGFNDITTLRQKMSRTWQEEYSLDEVRDWLRQAQERDLVSDGGNTGWWLTEQGSKAIDDALYDADFLTVIDFPMKADVLARLGLS